MQNHHWGIKTSQRHTTYEAIVPIWKEADQDPVFTHAWLFDHFNPIAGSVEGPCYEGWSMLAALAVQTERLRLGLMVAGDTYGCAYGLGVSIWPHPSIPASVTMRTTGLLAITAHLISVIFTAQRPPVLLLNCQAWWNRTRSMTLEFNRYPKRCARVDERTALIELVDAVVGRRRHTESPSLLFPTVRSQDRPASATTDSLRDRSP